MKIIIFLFLLIFSFSSCKKKYNCLCSTTVIYTNSQANYSSTNVPMTEKMTKKQAEAVCADEAENIDRTYLHYGNYSPGSANTICTLK